MNLVISYVVAGNALPKTGYVMGLLTVSMILTKTKQHVQRVLSSSSAQMADARIWKMFVTELIIAVITATKIKSVLVSYTEILEPLQV